MKKLFTPAFIILAFCCADKCSTDSLCTGEYVQWVENTGNGLHVSKSINKFTFDLQYKPLDYVVLKEGSDSVSTESDLDKMKKEIADMQYFTFRISSEDGGDLLQDDVSTTDQFSTRLAYFSSGMQHDIKLVEDGDTLNCLLFHFERTFGIDPRSTFVLGFPLEEKDGKGGAPSVSDKLFLYDDHELGTGPVCISVSSSSIENIPHLKLK